MFKFCTNLFTSHANIYLLCLANCTKRLTFASMDEILRMFRENFPFISREEKTLAEVIGHEGNVCFERRNLEGKLIACAIVNGQTILLLVVEKDYRGQGIGEGLLSECEDAIRQNGFDKAILGVGFNYLMPGVPTSKRWAPSVHEHLVPLVNTLASDFFEHRGYVHSWGECNCFDMRMELKDFSEDGHQIGDTINGILYRWAKPSDIEAICLCADDACQYQDESFSKYYRNADLYQEGNDQRVLVAEKQGRIVGTLIVSKETEGEDTGNVGCTCVATVETHQGIATKMVMLGTRYLKDIGLKHASLSYTYSNLDKMYGASGYSISTYYFMGEKPLL